MVKNHGGNKAKRQGRKFVQQSQMTVSTRLSNDPNEIYACCNKLFGNGRVGIICHDNKERICVIRNKFRGRGRRGNKIEVGTWLLVGKRDFEKEMPGKKETTDLLTVYGPRDITNLKQKEMIHAVAFKSFEKIGSKVYAHEEHDFDDNLQFVDEEDNYTGLDIPENLVDESDNEEYDDNVQHSGNGGEEEIDVDDI